jgi:hypothetical protein
MSAASINSSARSRNAFEIVEAERVGAVPRSLLRWRVRGYVPIKMTASRKICFFHLSLPNIRTSISTDNSIQKKRITPKLLFACRCAVPASL